MSTNSVRIIRPSLAEFSNFPDFLQQLDDRYGRSEGIVKVIPPIKLSYSHNISACLETDLNGVIRQTPVSHPTQKRCFVFEFRTPTKVPFKLKDFIPRKGNEGDRYNKLWFDGDSDGGDDKREGRKIVESVNDWIVEANDQQQKKKKKTSTSSSSDSKEDSLHENTNIENVDEEKAEDNDEVEESKDPSEISPKSKKAPKLNANLTNRRMETKFWNYLEEVSKSSRKTKIGSLYAADIPCSFFDVDSVWNLNELENPLKFLSKPIKGITNSMVYVATWGSTFCWHTEDYELNSINFLHEGAPKSWYAIPPTHAPKFEDLARSLFGQENEDCSQFMRHKTFMIPPTLLKKHQIPFKTVVQEVGEFVVTFSRGYHMGFNHGFNVAEAVNFVASPRWVNIGRQFGSPCLCANHSVKLDVNEIESAVLWRHWSLHSSFTQTPSYKKKVSLPSTHLISNPSVEKRLEISNHSSLNLEISEEPPLSFSPFVYDLAIEYAKKYLKEFGFVFEEKMILQDDDCSIETWKFQCYCGQTSSHLSHPSFAPQNPQFQCYLCKNWSHIHCEYGEDIFKNGSQEFPSEPLCFKCSNLVSYLYEKVDKIHHQQQNSASSSSSINRGSNSIQILATDKPILSTFQHNLEPTFDLNEDWRFRCYCGTRCSSSEDPSTFPYGNQFQCSRCGFWCHVVCMKGEGVKMEDLKNGECCFYCQFLTNPFLNQSIHSNLSDRIEVGYNDPTSKKKKKKYPKFDPSLLFTHLESLQDEEEEEMKRSSSENATLLLKGNKKKKKRKRKKKNDQKITNNSIPSSFSSKAKIIKPRRKLKFEEELEDLDNEEIDDFDKIGSILFQKRRRLSISGHNPPPPTTT